MVDKRSPKNLDLIQNQTKQNAGQHRRELAVLVKSDFMYLVMSPDSTGIHRNRDVSRETTTEATAIMSTSANCQRSHEVTQAAGGN